MTKAARTDRRSTWETYACHVAPGKVAAFEHYGFDATMGERAGARFHDAFSLRSWINCHSNGGVFNLGHRHPRVIAAVKGALDHVDIGNHHLVSAHRAELARRLAATTGHELDGVVFGVSGGEAIDLAVKLCRAHTGRSTIVSARGGYHGHTGLALAAGDPEYRDPFGPNLPGFVQVPFDDLQALDAAVDDSVAGVLLEPIPATLGMPIPAEGYLEKVAGLCRRRGALLVLDEVQTGLGRTGRMWCYEHEGVVPDLLVTGKGLSGGVVPITATLMRREILDFFVEHPFVHISTFGGAEIACAAALAVLDVVEAEGFLERVGQLSETVARELSGCRFELRRRGLMMALKFPQADAGIAAAQALFTGGVFAVYAANDTSAVQFLPPLVITDDELAEVLAVIRRLWS